MFETLDPLLQQMVDHKASDLYLSFGCPPSLRLSNRIQPLSQEPVTDAMLQQFVRELLTEDQQDEYEATLEFNSSIQWKDTARFRINVYQQQQHIGIVLRRITTDIPTAEALNLPAVYTKLIMEKRGLILVVGPTGSGKSTSLAAMLNHRNYNGSGHIVTIEDPIEFVHQHYGCIITQRDVGIDTYSAGIALKNALRQRPDVVLIGEIRDRETMEHAITFAETGHLCVATLHSNNANQTIERILNFFPEEAHKQILLNLSLNLRGILAQRLILKQDGERILATEVMLNNGLIKTLIEEGNVRNIKELMERSNAEGMHSFDQSLFDLAQREVISAQTAINESDNPANMRLNFNQLKASAKLAENKAKPSASGDNDTPFKI